MGMETHFFFHFLLSDEYLSKKLEKLNHKLNYTHTIKIKLPYLLEEKPPPVNAPQPNKRCTPGGSFIFLWYNLTRLNATPELMPQVDLLE